MTILPVRALLSVLLCVSASAAQIVLEPPVTSDGGGYARRALIGDVNEDGLPDALVGHFLFSPEPMLALGLGDGGFAPPQFVSAAREPRRLVDFDGDGHLDLLHIAGAQPPWNVAVRLGNGDGSFGPGIGVNTAHPTPFDADVGDFDADGSLDIAILNDAFAFGGQMASVVVTFGNGDGSFDPPVVVASQLAIALSSFQNAGLRVGDSNGDGFDDILYVHSTASPVLLSQGNGSFVPAACTGCTVVFEHDFMFADLDGDSRDDLLTPRRALLATPQGSFTVAQTFELGPGAISIGAGDLDGDGRTDAVIGRNASGQSFDLTPVGDVVVLRGNGNGTFQAPGTVVSHVLQPGDLAVADVDVDGRPDVVAASFLESEDSVRTLLNHTYGAGSPFLDLGHALAGSNGAPIQLAEGMLVAGAPFAFRLANGPAGGAAYHVVGASQLAAPFKGGVMIPAVHLVNGPLPLDASGGITLGGAWPGGAEGLTLYLQFWMPAAGGPSGFAASSGVRAQVP
jgi:hypothetical protein